MCFMLGILFLSCVSCGAHEVAAMQIQFSMEGGIASFPGLSRPVGINTDQLTSEETAKLGRLVEAAEFFNLPPQIGKPSRGAADYRQYTVTIEEGPRRHTIRMIDPVENTDLKRLLAFIRAKANELRVRR